MRLVAAVAEVLHLAGGVGAVRALGVQNAHYGGRRLGAEPTSVPANAFRRISLPTGASEPPLEAFANGVPLPKPPLEAFRPGAEPPLEAFRPGAQPPLDAFADGVPPIAPPSKAAAPAAPPPNAFPLFGAAAVEQKMASFDAVVDHSLESTNNALTAVMNEAGAKTNSTFNQPTGMFAVGQNFRDGRASAPPSAVLLRMKIVVHSKADAQHVASRIQSSTFALALAKQLSSLATTRRDGDAAAMDDSSAGVRVLFDPIVSFSVPILRRIARAGAAARAMAVAAKAATTKRIAEQQAKRKRALVPIVILCFITALVLLHTYARRAGERKRERLAREQAEALPLHEVKPGCSVTTADNEAL